MTLVEEGQEDSALDKIIQIIKRLSSPLIIPDYSTAAKSTKNLKSNFEKDQFCDAVRKVKEHIVAGDAYQLVVSQLPYHTSSPQPV